MGVADNKPAGLFFSTVKTPAGHLKHLLCKTPPILTYFLF